MTEASDRSSNRVAHDAGDSAGQRSMGLPTAPESMPSSARVPRLLAAGAPERRRRLSADELDRIAVDLSARDRAVLASIIQYGFLTSRHVDILHFADFSSDKSSGRTCRRVLRQLADRQLIEPVEHRIGGVRAGSSSIVWRIGRSGDRLLRREHPDQPKARRKEPSLRFLQHRLRVADAVCDLTLAARAEVFELLQVANEPATWRTFSGIHGAREILKPDLFAITAAGDYEDHWFIEIDRGTESLPTVLKQCEVYERYRHSGREQRETGLFPRVLWLVPDTHRAQSLHTAVKRRPDLDDDLFRVYPMDDLLTAVAQAGVDEPEGAEGRS
jgi:hypothetical protein